MITDHASADAWSPLVRSSILLGAAGALLLVIDCQAFAEGAPLRVVYAEVPGTPELEAGDIDAGIELLQDQLETVDRRTASEVWATLCAAYIVTRSMDRAARPCNEAVKAAPTYAALNNRGVYRAFSGDLAGARADFERARPQQLDAYIEELTTRDVRVIAAGNYSLINEILATRGGQGMNAKVGTNSASIEDLDEQFRP